MDDSCPLLDMDDNMLGLIADPVGLLGLCKELNAAAYRLTRLYKSRPFRPLPDLAKMFPNLQEVDCSNTKLRDIEMLRGCTGLERLSLALAPQEKGEPSILEPLACLTALQSLSIDRHACEYPPRLIWYRPYNLVKSVDWAASCPRLQSLILGDCQLLKSIKALSGCPALQKLKLDVCWSLKSLDGLESCTALQTLDLTDCESLTSIDALRTCTALQTLTLIFCVSLTSIDALRECTALQTVQKTDGMPKIELL
jgi:Leucine-rich repeat (LRR) protein